MPRFIARYVWSMLSVPLVDAGWQPLPAQQVAADQPSSIGVVLKTTVSRVIVDVVVVDAHGQSVRGLSCDDFSVKEDGKPQAILSFEPHDMESWAALAPSGLPANTFVNLPVQPERGPLYVLLYDMVNTTVDDQIFVRYQLVKFVAAKPPSTRFSLLAVSDGLHLM